MQSKKQIPVTPECRWVWQISLSPFGLNTFVTILLILNGSGRDRFLLSNGHGSMLQYALLHLAGYDLTIDDLKNFRQLHSKTPGHPKSE